LSDKIFITGGTGFLGAYIIKELTTRGYRVRALRRSSKLPSFIPESVFDKVEWFDGDILDVVSLADAMEGVDTVIHAAAVISFIPRLKKMMHHVNIDGTANVVNIALEKNISRLVHISSVAALGRTMTGGQVSEEKKWQDSKVNTDYAISKFRAEMEVWRGVAEGLNAVIVNPSTIIGYGDWDSSSTRIFKSIYDEFPWYTNGINGFVDVEDVARATVLLMESGTEAERYIVNGDNWSFRQLFDTIAENFNKRKPRRNATPLLGQLAWRLEAVKSWFGSNPVVTKQSALVAQSRTYFDNSKILKALPGFSFTPLEDSVRKACRRYLETVPSLKTR
jgi:dihydroflavonol-4-reductase